MKTIRYWLKAIGWLWNHKDERNCNQKFKRMARDLEGVKQRDINRRAA